MAAGVESTIRVNGADPAITIRLNEPVRIQGYSLSQGIAQSSAPSSTLLLVKHDPGHLWVGLGELLLIAGVLGLAARNWRAETPSMVSSA
jgi:hypothetical protein